MNERIRELELEAYNFANAIALPGNYTDEALSWYRRESFNKKFAELIVRECLTIAKNKEDELENHNRLSESNAVGIVAYRIARQFGVKE